MKLRYEKENLLWCLILLVLAFIYFSTVSRPIRDAESKYVEIPREILVTGDWITPYLNFVKYYTKPPLSFWLVALGYKIFGVHVWVARSINIMWGFFLAFLIGLMASHIFGRRSGLIASIIFLLTSEVFAYSLDAGIEFALISCITASLLYFWKFWKTGEKRYLRYFYMWAGAGYLVKGLLGFCIPFASVSLFILITEGAKGIKHIIEPLGVLIFLILILPWTIVMSVKNPDFLKYFLINEHIGRITGHRDTSEALFPTSSFLAHMAGEFFPWVIYTPFLLKAIYTGIKQKGILRESTVFLLLWASVPFVLFCISKNKVDFYGLHVYPALIILLSNEIKDVFKRKNGLLKLWAYPWILLSIIALFSFIFLCINPESSFIKSLDIPSLLWAKIFLFGSFLSGLVIWKTFMKRRIISAFLVIALYMCFFFVCTEKMYIADFDKDSMKFAADVYNQLATENSPIFCSDLPEFAHVATINFYTNRPVYILLSPGDNLPEFQDRRKMYVSDEDFIRIVKEKKMVFLVGKTEDIKKRLKKMGLNYNMLKVSNGRAIFLVLPKD